MHTKSLACLLYVSEAVAAGILPAFSAYQSPRFRWWWPGGWIDPNEAGTELESIIEAGWGGAEIGDVRDSVHVEEDPELYGWASSRWNAGVLKAYEVADK